MGDGMRMMGNPNMQTALGSRGGLHTLPAKVSELLTKDPAALIGSPNFGSRSIPVTQFNALNDMLSKGNKGLALGSDVDRALLNQASRIASPQSSRITLIADPDQPKGDIQREYISLAKVNETVSAMMSNASVDHQAVADFLHAGPAMDRVAGGHFDNGHAFEALATVHFGPNDHGWKDMLDWIGPNAHTPGFEGHQAAVAADSLARLTSAHHELLGGKIPILNDAGEPSGQFESLGQRDPELVKAMTRNLTPYFGNLGGIEVPGIDRAGIPGFGNSGELKDLFKVLSSDPASAEGLMAAAASWEHYYAERYGETGLAQYARAAGQLQTALLDGYHAELDAMTANSDTARILEYNQRSADWDSKKGMISDVFGALPFSKVPGGDALSFLGKIVIDGYNPYLKLDELAPLTPSNNPELAAKTALENTVKDFRVLNDSLYRDYSIVTGYEIRDPSIVSAFRNVQTPDGPKNFFVPDGSNGWKLDWDTVKKYWNAFDQAYTGLQHSSQVELDSWKGKYLDGIQDTDITRNKLPGPGDVSKPPGGR